MEQQWGYSAMHHGTFPMDWVKPGGDKTDNYRETCAQMQSSKNVLEKGELRQPKCTREEHRCERRVTWITISKLTDAAVDIVSRRLLKIKSMIHKSMVTLQKKILGWMPEVYEE